MKRILLACATLGLTVNSATAQNPNYSYYRGGMSGAPAASGFNTGFYTAGQQGAPHPQAGASQPSLEQVLNAIDRPQAWNQTPVSAAPQSHQMATSNQNQRGMMPRVSRKEMARMFMEGGSPQFSGGGGFGAPAPTDSSAATSNAYSNYKTAMNEETKAREAANRARYNSDSWVRKNSASQAEYAARNANNAAQRAQSASYNGGSQAQGYANMARQCANRARQSANQARYNADTIR